MKLEEHMYPPEGATLVFMGCGNRDSAQFTLGIIAAPNEIFGQADYEDQAKPVKNFYTYHTTSPVIGFTKEQEGLIHKA